MRPPALLRWSLVASCALIACCAGPRVSATPPRSSASASALPETAIRTPVALEAAARPSAWPLGLQPNPPASSARGEPFLDQLTADFAEFYDAGTLTRLALGIGAAAALANGGTDEAWQQAIVDDVDEEDESSVWRALGRPGHYLISLGLYGAALSIARWRDVDPEAAPVRWAWRGLRSLAVGAPTMLVLQYTTGGSRPYEERGSDWRLFDDTNGASGHSFVGGIPFLVAARMNEPGWVRWSLYGASFVPSWSRVERNRHYTSQALLGWWVGWLSVESVFDGDRAARGPGDGPDSSVLPWVGPDAVGLRWEIGF